MPNIGDMTAEQVAAQPPYKTRGLWWPEPKEGEKMKWKKKDGPVESFAARANREADARRRKCPQCGRMIIFRGGRFDHHKARWERDAAGRLVGVVCGQP